MRRLSLVCTALMAGLLFSGPVSAQTPPEPASVPTSGLDLFSRREPTPFVVGGVLLDIDRLSAADAPLRRRGVLLSGTADHAGTARLAQPMRLTAPLINDLIPAGTVLHKVEFYRPGPRSNTVTTWCGDLDRRTVFGTPSVPVCFLVGDVLRQAFVAGDARAWLVNSSRVYPGVRAKADVFELEAPSPTDLIGPMDVRFELQRVTRNEITVRLLARRNDQDVLVMTMKRPIENGQAVIPLWTHRLVLIVSGDTVTPTLSGGGDGFGPPEFGEYP